MAVTAKNRAESTTPSSGPFQFLREVIDELRKVVWPTWSELYRYTLIVIFTVIVLGAFIGGVDYLLGELFRRLLYVAGQ
jgi:preprotein translocase subunit SecE